LIAIVVTLRACGRGVARLLVILTMLRISKIQKPKRQILTYAVSTAVDHSSCLVRSCMEIVLEVNCDTSLVSSDVVVIESSAGDQFVAAAGYTEPSRGTQLASADWG